MDLIKGLGGEVLDATCEARTEVWVEDSVGGNADSTTVAVSASGTDLKAQDEQVEEDVMPESRSRSFTSPADAFFHVLRQTKHQHVVEAARALIPSLLLAGPLPKLLVEGPIPSLLLVGPRWHPSVRATPHVSKTFYDFTVKDVNGKKISMDWYRGQVVIVVNVASGCGLTTVNYSQLKIIQEKYYDQGLRVAAFPCNQFGLQEPECAIEVAKFLKEKFDYEPDLYGKIYVNSEEADPLFKWLKHEKGGSPFAAIKWNFTKFLINRKGQAVKRFSPITKPLSFVDDIEKLLAETGT